MNPAAIRLFATDLEGTILGNPDATWRFTGAWLSLGLAERPLLVYSTRLTAAETRSLATTRHLPAPNYIIGGLGTELLDVASGRTDDLVGYSHAWDTARVDAIIRRFPAVTRQTTEARHPLRSSWVWDRARPEQLSELQRQFETAGIKANVSYSCRYFLDVVPAWAGKGNALARLCRRLEIDPRHVLVAGDTAVDLGMFQLPGVRGIVVQNALPELATNVAPADTFAARGAMADGVLEGLAHFGVMPNREAVTATTENQCNAAVLEPSSTIAALGRRSGSSPLSLAKTGTSPRSKQS